MDINIYIYVSRLIGNTPNPPEQKHPPHIQNGAQWAEAQVTTEATEEIWNDHAWTRSRWACIGLYQGYATKKCATTHEIYLYTYIYIEIYSTCKYTWSCDAM